MDQLIAPADSEQAIIDELTSVYIIGTSIPENKPTTFVRVVQTGGTSRDLVTDVFTVVIEVFSKMESTANEVASNAIARLQLAARKGRVGNAVCYGIEIAALPQNFPLPSVQSHKRYTTTITLAIRRRITTL